MSFKPTETTLATILWALHVEDDGMTMTEIAERSRLMGRRPNLQINELLRRRHITIHQGLMHYHITPAGREWLQANRHLVADAVLDAARGRVPSFVFQLAAKPTQTTGEQS